MATVDDVAAYIVGKLGQVSAMKLQKLLYYSQAWSLVWEERPIFVARIEAWASGPVCPAIFAKHRGQYLVTEWPSGSAEHLDEADRKTVDSVVDFYGDKDPQWLSDLTHREEPWIRARVGIPLGDRGEVEITLESMLEYYSSIPDTDQ